MKKHSGADRIVITDLRVRSVVGINQWEQNQKQEVSISLALYTDLKIPGTTDRIEDTVDYKVLKKKIIKLVETIKFQLIERMAEDIANICLDDPKVEQVHVTVDKLGALRFARSVAVEITRPRTQK